MFRDSYNPRGVSVDGLLKRTITMISVLVLGIGSAGRAVPAYASPPEQTKTKVRIKIYFDIKMPPEPICAGQEYPILVTTMADHDFIRNGKSEHYDTKPQSGPSVEVSSSNPAAGTISPKKIQSGWDPEANPGEAQFSFEAKKAGSTDLNFQGTWKRQKFKDKITINVVNCKVKVTMNYLMRQSSGGTTGLVIGQLDTLLEGDGETYGGTAILDSDRTHTVPGCSLSFSGFENPATMTGKRTGSPGNEQLELTIAYEPAESSLTATCPIVGTITTTGTEDPTNWLATNATFSGTGGAQSFPINFAQWFGRLIITVTPVEGSPS